MTRAYRAYGIASSCTAETPRAAATLFFTQYPTRRKCNVIEGLTDGHIFTVRYGPRLIGVFKGITKKTAANLPGGD